MLNFAKFASAVMDLIQITEVNFMALKDMWKKRNEKNESTDIVPHNETPVAASETRKRALLIGNALDK
jgi:hypothetical protein